MALPNFQGHHCSPGVIDPLLYPRINYYCPSCHGLTDDFSSWYGFPKQWQMVAYPEEKYKRTTVFRAKQTAVIRRAPLAYYHHWDKFTQVTRTFLLRKRQCAKCFYLSTSLEIMSDLIALVRGDVEV